MTSRMEGWLFVWAGVLALACGLVYLQALLRPDSNSLTRLINRSASERHVMSIGSTRQRIIAVVIVCAVGALLFLTLGVQALVPTQM